MGSIPGQEDPLEEGTPVFLPGESQGQRILVDYNPKSHDDLDISETTQHSHTSTRLPMQEMQFPSLGQEDSLEEDRAGSE